MSWLADEWFKGLACRPSDPTQHPTTLPTSGVAYSLGSIVAAERHLDELLRAFAASAGTLAIGPRLNRVLRLAPRFEKVRSAISANNRKLRSPSGPL